MIDDTVFYTLVGVALLSALVGALAAYVFGRLRYDAVELRAARQAGYLEGHDDGYQQALDDAGDDGVSVLWPGGGSAA